MNSTPVERRIGFVVYHQTGCAAYNPRAVDQQPLKLTYQELIASEIVLRWVRGELSFDSMCRGLGQ